MLTGTYDPANNAFSFLGNLITGYAPDTFIVVERANDTFTMQEGAGGEVTRIRNRSRTGSFTITLMNSSQSNDVLSAIAAQDELFGTGVGVAFLKELNGTSQAVAAQAWIRKTPNMERAKEAGTTEWVIDCAVLDARPGGLLF